MGWLPLITFAALTRSPGNCTTMRVNRATETLAKFPDNTAADHRDTYTLMDGTRMESATASQASSRWPRQSAPTRRGNALPGVSWMHPSVMVQPKSFLARQ